MPFSAAAVNPAPLPATALMQFNPLPDVTGLPATGTTLTIPVHVAGSFHQILTPPIISMGTGPAIGFPAKLDVAYTIDGTATVTVTPPTAAQPGTYSATFNVAGKYTATFFPWSFATIQPPWIITGKYTEQGGVKGPLNSPSPTAVDPMTFTATIGTQQTETRLSSSPLGTTPWSVQATVVAGGTFLVNPNVSSSTLPVKVTT
ncbi:MAG TPA: hypothetical protein VH120_21650, partial [Gemmataceae bacterium]|nr:hypothetical protein [Gemmataceae bacterium]